MISLNTKTLEDSAPFPTPVNVMGVSVVPFWDGAAKATVQPEGADELPVSRDR